MNGRVLALSGLITSVTLLVTLVPRGGVLTEAKSQPASLDAPASVPVALVAAPEFGDLSLLSVATNDQPPISDNQWKGQQDQFDTHAAVTKTEWDDADSHKWIGEPWGDGIKVDWVEFDGRRALQAVITSTAKSWAIMRTDAFPSENWETKTGLRADIYQVGGASSIDIKLEVRGPCFDPPDLIETIYCEDLQPNTWNTCTWNFNTVGRDYSAVSHLSIVFDHLNHTAPTFYVDNLRVVSTSGEEEWDDMDDGSRWWFYSGHWHNWNPCTPFGLEPITHYDANPSTPVGSVYLQWARPGDAASTQGVAFLLTGSKLFLPLVYLRWDGINTAEVGTSRLDDRPDWSGYNRISADVKVSDPDVPISVFVWNADAISMPVDYRGYGAPPRKVGVADSWQTITWDLPWPPWFDNTGIDEVKFVVNDTYQHPTGTLYLDNICLVSDTLPSPVTGLAYVFEDFNDRNRYFNDFSGNWGELNGDYITTTFVTTTHTSTREASLRVDYDLRIEPLVGIWQSLWGHSDHTQTQYIDFTDIYGNLNEEAKEFEQIHFWVRGSGATTGTHNLKVELKDNTGDFDRTAYRYITIDDSDTSWREVVLDADVTNSSFWSYNRLPPDPTRMKQLVFVIESFFNTPTGTFYMDDINFVDADDGPFDLDEHTDDEFLDFVSKKTFLYFLDWYDPNTGLFHDRSTFPDLMSTAATGFGLTALAIGESRGWIDRTVATDMITRTLRSLRGGQAATDTVTDTITGTNGYKGFFYHFLGNDGLRKNRASELSSVDTAILLAGALTVREHFDDVPEVVALADELYRRVEWDWMLDSANNQFYLAWKPQPSQDYGIKARGGGYFSNYHWDYYTDEVILINLLAIGSPTHPVPEDVFYAWARNRGQYTSEDKSKTYELVHSWNGSFFTYVFAHLWVDFAMLGTDKHPTSTLQVDWWDNSVRAARANWQFAVDHGDDTACDGDDDFTTYGERSWGLTAAEGPDEIAHQMWNTNTTDVRALPGQEDNSGVRKAAAAYSKTSFEVDVHVTDEVTHELSLYVLDWDDAHREETVQIRDLANGEPLTTSGKVTDFSGGKYVRFAFDGSIKVLLSRDGISNTVLSGIFFDPSETMWTGTAGGAHAAYLGLDSDTQGNWGGKYGTDGYVLVNWMGDGSDLSKLPGYVESLSFNGGYHAYGALPVDPGNVVDHDGTIAPYGAGMGMMFLPGKAVPALKHYFANPDLWRHRFGFGDAYNLDPPDCSGFWYNHVAFGIDQGPMLISIENCRSRLIWETMKRNEYVSQALHSVWRALCVPISGPKTGTANEVYTFTATVSPITVATPITYVWQATGKSPVTHTGGISDTAVFSWGTTGGKAITVTATNAYGTGTGTCVIHICHKLYLPLVLKQG